MWTYRIEVMTCGGCAGRITRAIAQLDPVATVTADLPNHLLRVASATAGAEEVRQAIASAGYDAELVPDAPPAAASPRQGGCCCAARRATSAVDVPQSPKAAHGACCG